MSANRLLAAHLVAGLLLHRLRSFGNLSLSTEGAFELDGAGGIDVDGRIFLVTNLLGTMNGPHTEAFFGTIQIGHGDRQRMLDP